MPARLALALASLCAACAALADDLGGTQRSLEVTASAYNSHAAQTDGDPQLAAWGDVLEPGMRAIAVSQDLIDLGLSRGVRVRIEGLPGSYQVLDAMPTHWERKIDIYMGEDVDAARRWGVRRVRIHWQDGSDLYLPD
jgi:3D (Asp-Asp-Asp) domain-containing protein